VGIRTLILASLLLIVIVSMLALALLMIRIQRRADENCVLIDERIANASPSDVSRPVTELSLQTSRDSERSSSPRSAGASVEIAASPALPCDAPIVVARSEGGSPAAVAAAADDYAMRAPVELRLGDTVIGVRHGSGTYDSFRKYADVLLDDLKATRRAAR